MKRLLQIIAVVFAVGLIARLLSGNKETEAAESKPEVANTPEIATEYEIFATKHTNAIENYFVVYKGKISETNLNSFAKKFKEDNCKGNCNVSIFDTNEVLPLLEKGHYDLQGKEYVYFADHFIGKQTFDTESIWMYPYKGKKYRELGGKN